MTEDQSQRFVFANTPIRGEIVKLHSAYSEMLQSHDYPLPLKQLLGEALAAVSLLSATLKYQGSMIMQAEGDGPVSLLVTQANDKREIRGLAKWSGAVPESFAAALGTGKLMITINPSTTTTRYQGVVNLHPMSLAKTIENYFDQSEQLPTFILLAADGKKAAGLLLQLLPQGETTDIDHWQNALHLAKTMTTAELLMLPSEQILHRLFHQETITLFTPEPIKFACQCSKERTANAILTLGYEEAMSILKENQVIVVTCEFCNRQITFARGDVDAIFSEK